MDQPGTSTGAKICTLCKQRSYIYTCPRCGIGYCSTDCYKSETHLECSESFYKQCIEEELKSQERDPEAKRRMVDILKRLHQEDQKDIFSDELEDSEEEDEENDHDEDETQLDSDDEEAQPNLEERLQNVNLDDADEVWAVLTEAEKQEFQALLKSGEVEKILPQWIPWWTYRGEKKLIADVEENLETNDYTKKCPMVIDVPNFPEIQKASPNVRFNLVNVIYSYAYVALFYNGDYQNCADEAVVIFLEICSNMRENKVFDDANSAVESVIQNILDREYLPQDEQTLFSMKEAAALILQGPEEKHKNYFISVALSELHRLVTTARKTIVKSKTTLSDREFSRKFVQKSRTSVGSISSKMLLLCIKKLEYYLSWIKSHDESICT